MTFSCDALEYPEYNGSWIESVTISKRQVEKPEPSTLAFECSNWETGAGAMQNAFSSLDESMYSFVPGEKADDGLPSSRTASDVGKYKACFRLNDPETCQWKGESEEVSEIWVPWSIGFQKYDPNEVTYWGTTYDNNTTTVTYAGGPQWVRPWSTYAKDTNGEFPEWFSHWGDAGRPTTDKRSACVFYLSGDDDQEGLVGYHENADGTLEKVTAAQVYAWANGVDIDGRHVDVKSGEKVWYRTGEDGWWVPVAVGGKRPAGAEGFVVARDYAWADLLGVMDAGTYRAFALFDEGAGFAATDIAESTVKVMKAANAMSAKGKAVTASAKKGGSFGAADAFRVAKAQGKVTFQKAKGNAKIAVSKAGEVTVAAGLKAGKTYRANVEVSAKGDANHKKATQGVTLKVKVK